MSIGQATDNRVESGVISCRLNASKLVELEPIGGQSTSSENLPLPLCRDSEFCRSLVCASRLFRRASLLSCPLCCCFCCCFSECSPSSNTKEKSCPVAKRCERERVLGS